MGSMLVLGGTRFIGYAVAEAAIAAGWDVSVLHRGFAPSPPGVHEILIGDRTDPAHLILFEGRRWDAVVDTWSGDPDPIRSSAMVLCDKVDRYVYVSSQSVYVWPSAAGADEGAPTVPSVSTDGPLDYATRKRMAEIAVLDVFCERSLIARAGLLLGPRELPSRLPWWLDRIAKGGHVPLPGSPDFEIQYLDGRDLADWIILSLERETVGIFNTIGPIGGTTMGEIMSACRAITDSDAMFHWINQAAIEREGIAPWTSLPLWIQPGADYGAVYRRDVTKALETGLKQRSVHETVSAAWDWTKSQEGQAALSKAGVGLTADEERRLLAHI